MAAVPTPVLHGCPLQVYQHLKDEFPELTLQVRRAASFWCRFRSCSRSLYRYATHAGSLELAPLLAPAWNTLAWFSTAAPLPHPCLHADKRCRQAAAVLVPACAPSCTAQPEFRLADSPHVCPACPTVDQVAPAGASAARGAAPRNGRAGAANSQVDRQARALLIDACGAYVCVGCFGLRLHPQIGK